MRRTALVSLLLLWPCAMAHAQDAPTEISQDYFYPVVDEVIGGDAPSCDDDVVGKWVSLMFFPEEGVSGTWYKFTMMIDRAEASGLTGSIHAHTWAGALHNIKPVPCEISGWNIEVVMTAGGLDYGGGFEFNGLDWELVTSCSDLGPDFSYMPDRFSGRLDENGRLWAYQNDDAYVYDLPVVFDRVACEP